MKNYFITVLFLLAGFRPIAQVTVSNGAHLITNGNITVTLHDIDFVANGIVHAEAGNFKFSGWQNSTISGSSLPLFGKVEIIKTSNASVLLGRSIFVKSSVSFISGLLDLNGNNITLAPDAIVAGESENNRIVGAKGGYLELTQNIDAPSSANPGNLGAVISSTANLGTVTIKRGHLPQSGTGLSSSINRYYVITPQNNSGLNATLRFTYFDAENIALNENSFVLYQTNDGTNWNNLSQTIRNTTSNYVEKTSIGSLSKFTLGADAVVTPGCSATGVALTVKAAKQNTVSVTWTTATETNNKGFAVERKLKGETVFTQIGYVSSKAIGGNSSTQLSYSFTDSNTPTDTAWYRLRILSLTDNICFSDTKTFVPKGGGKGKPNNNATLVDAKQGELLSAQPELTVGPNPNNGNFFFSINGLDQPTTVELYTIDGKVISRFTVSNMQRQQVNGLKAGVYILKVTNKQLLQKIIVQ